MAQTMPSIIHHRMVMMIVTAKNRVVIIEDNQGMRFPFQTLKDNKSPPTINDVYQAIEKEGYDARVVTDLGSLPSESNELLHVYLVRGAFIVDGIGKKEVGLNEFYDALTIGGFFNNDYTYVAAMLSIPHLGLGVTRVTNGELPYK